jgi:hypothetical protein
MINSIVKFTALTFAGMVLIGCSVNSNQTAQDSVSTPDVVSSENLIAYAKLGYDAFKVNDMEAWALTQADDAVWTMPKGFPYGGTYIGPEDVIKNVFAPIAEYWPDFKVEPISYHASGNTVFIRTKMTTGGEVSDSLHVAVIENGKYIKFQVFDDTHFMMKSAKKVSTE